MGIEYIENRRRDHVKVEAQSLFDSIVEHVIVQTPSDSYTFRVHNVVNAAGIDEMVLQRTQDLFLEIGASLKIARLSGNEVEGVLQVSGTTDYKVEKLKKFFWSRRPGKFVNKHSGEEVKLSTSTNDIFTGTVREWYETFIETIIDAGYALRRATLIGQPVIVYVSPEILPIIESSVLYQPSYVPDSVYTGVLAGQFKIIKDSSLKHSALAVLAKDGVKYEVEIEVLNMNII